MAPPFVPKRQQRAAARRRSPQRWGSGRGALRSLWRSIGKTRAPLSAAHSRRTPNTEMCVDRPLSFADFMAASFSARRAARRLIAARPWILRRPFKMQWPGSGRDSGPAPRSDRRQCPSGARAPANTPHHRAYARSPRSSYAPSGSAAFFCATCCGGWRKSPGSLADPGFMRAGVH